MPLQHSDETPPGSSARTLFAGSTCSGVTNFTFLLLVSLRLPLPLQMEPEGQVFAEPREGVACCADVLRRLAVGEQRHSDTELALLATTRPGG